MKPISSALQKIAASIFMMACMESAFADVTLTNLTVENLAVDTTGVNKFVSVSPTQAQCYAVGYSVLLFNDSGENAHMAYATLLTAIASGKMVEITHDGTSYCKILRVKLMK